MEIVGKSSSGRAITVSEFTVERVDEDKGIVHCVDEFENRWTQSIMRCQFIKKGRKEPKRQVIGFTGLKGSGKDTAAAGLGDYANVKMAGALKEMIRAFMRYIRIGEGEIERCIEGDLKEVPRPYWGGRTTRYVMQHLGTDFGRNMVWDGIWVNAFKLCASGYDRVACTDVRFPNEVTAIHELGGKVIGIIRPGQDNRDAHASEAEIANLDVDMIVLNDGTVRQLQDAVKRVVDGWG